jgi:hypothetical protein
MGLDQLVCLLFGEFGNRFDPLVGAHVGAGVELGNLSIA